MRRLLLLSLISLYSAFSFAQPNAERFRSNQLKNKYLSPTELKNQLSKLDFSSLFTQTDNAFVYGFIGDNYQRIRVKIISITKTTDDTYTVYGKSMVKNNIDEFRGTLKITNIRKYKETHYGVDDEYKSKGIKGAYVITGTYNFAEGTNQQHSGVFKGAFSSEFYLDKANKVHYDDIELNADGYANNQFVGQWVSYAGKAKTCNWGDYRIADCGDLDIGAGEFSPNDKYIGNGWQKANLSVGKWWK
jgi:hypothetical protein